MINLSGSLVLGLRWLEAELSVAVGAGEWSCVLGAGLEPLVEAVHVEAVCAELEPLAAYARLLL